MGASLIGLVLGALSGAATGTELGICLGAVTGVLIGMSIDAFFWLRAHLGSSPTTERHLAVCAVYGQTADCEFVGDLGSGRWYDVQRCSLLGSPNQVDCEKGCLKLMSANGVRPGGTCRCHSSR